VAARELFFPRLKPWGTFPFANPVQFRKTLTFSNYNMQAFFFSSPISLKGQVTLANPTATTLFQGPFQKREGPAPENGGRSLSLPKGTFP